jgi:putative serine protease PepD
LGVEFKKGFATGSGVMVGKGDDVCYVATDYHNFAADKGDALKRVETKLYGGKRYDATIAASDPANDIALLAVRTGPDTAAVCKPAVVAENPAAVRGPGATFGFPKEARTLYASPTEFQGTESLQDFMRTRGPKGGRPLFSPGENPKRDILITASRTHQGNSGGPMYNAAGEVTGLLGGGVPNDARISYGNVLTRATVDRWLEQVRAK